MTVFISKHTYAMVELEAGMKFCKGNHSEKMKTFRIMKLALDDYTNVIMYTNYI